MYGLITVIHVSTNRTEILRQLAYAVVKGLISVFEVQLHIPPVFPQSQEADANIQVMRSDLPLRLRRFVPRLSCYSNFIEDVAVRCG